MKKLKRHMWEKDIYDYSELASKYGYKTVDSKNIKRDFLDWKRNLNTWEIICLWLYRWSSKRINKHLRENNFEKNNHTSVKWLGKIEQGIYSALSKGMIEDNIAVYRCLAIGEDNFFKTKKIGDIIEGEKEYKGYKGTHVDRKIQKNHMLVGLPSAFLIILIPARTSCAYVNFWVLLFKIEKELLINKNQKYRLVDKTTIFDRPAYICEIIGLNY